MRATARASRRLTVKRERTRQRAACSFRALLSSCLEPAPGLSYLKGIGRLETRSASTVCGMAGSRRHGACRIDASDFPRHAGRRLDDGHGGRLRDGLHGHGPCRSPPSRRARSSRRPDRPLRVLRAAYAYARGRPGHCPGAATARIADTRTGDRRTTRRTFRAIAERATKRTAVVHQRLILRRLAARSSTSMRYRETWRALA